jgi:DNA-binding transcriptional LysR family regulator
MRVQMDWDKLKTFHAAAEQLSLTAAATRLGVSQSAVSRQIASLEHGLSVTLFHRHARGLVLTDAGVTLLEATRDMAASAALAESMLKDTRDRPQGELRVTAPVALGALWLVPRLGRFQATYPEVRLHLLLDDREYDLGRLEAECALRLGGATHPDLVQRKILEVEASLYASLAYLEQAGTPPAPAALDDHRIIAYGAPEDSPMQDLDWAMRAGRDGAAPRPCTLRVNNVYGMLKAVEAGLGIGSLPDYMARTAAGLVRLFPDHAGTRFDVFFVYPAELRNSQRVAAFRRFLLDETAHQPPETASRA